LARVAAFLSGVGCVHVDPELIGIYNPIVGNAKALVGAELPFGAPANINRGGAGREDFHRQVRYAYDFVLLDNCLAPGPHEKQVRLHHIVQIQVDVEGNVPDLSETGSHGAKKVCSQLA
jgi:hypothetical protein